MQLSLPTSGLGNSSELAEMQPAPLVAPSSRPTTEDVGSQETPSFESQLAGMTNDHDGVEPQLLIAADSRSQMDAVAEPQEERDGVSFVAYHVTEQHLTAPLVSDAMHNHNEQKPSLVLPNAPRNQGAKPAAVQSSGARLPALAFADNVAKDIAPLPRANSAGIAEPTSSGYPVTARAGSAVEPLIGSTTQLIGGTIQRGRQGPLAEAEFVKTQTESPNTELLQTPPPRTQITSATTQANPLDLSNSAELESQASGSVRTTIESAGENALSLPAGTTSRPHDRNFVAETVALPDGPALTTAAVPFNPAPDHDSVQVREQPLEIKAASPVEAQLRDAVVSQSRYVSSNGHTYMEVQLDPPELGTVRIQLSESEHGMRAKLVVANESTLRTIESELPTLRQSLADAGVSIDQFDLSQNNRGEQWDEAARGDEIQPPTFRQTGSQHQSPIETPQARTSDYQIDLVV